MTMSAGKYYIGDLCYVMHDKWDEFCSITIDGNKCLDGEFELANGTRFATYGTAYGDGVYPASNGEKLCVDAGIIGCILLNDIKDTKDNNIDLGCIVDFPVPFETGENNGVIYFGHVSVNTKFEDDYEEEFDYYEE